MNMQTVLWHFLRS